MSARDRLRALKDALVQDIDDTHPEAISRLDALDGVGATRTGTTHPKKHTSEEEEPSGRT